ncbi:MAG: hypothetical protein ABIT16_09815 [Croceibacterium sp.]
MPKWRWLAVALIAAIITLVAAAEAVVRFAGARDFAIYDASDEVGYIPTASQSGAFLNKYRWAFNEHHMGTAKPFRPSADSVLLIGDSIVLGGNRLDQPTKLGPQLERQIGCPVWPLSAGSWALLNELHEMAADPDVLNVGTVVIVLNSGDFGEPSVWKSELTHPRYRPWLTSLYIAHRLAFPPIESTASVPSQAATRAWRTELARFMARYPGKVTFVLYPNKAETKAGFAPFPVEVGGREVSPAALVVKSSRAPSGEVVRLIDDPRWSAAHYRDGIHPDAAGNRVVAQILADHLPHCGGDRPAAPGGAR